MFRLKTILIIFTAGVISFCSQHATFAQNKNDDIRDKIEKIKLEKMVKKMDLDESTAEIFTDRYKTFSKTLRELNQKRAKAYLQMTQNIESGTGLDSLLDEVLNVENQIDQERLNFVTDLKSFLTSKQIAVMIVFERKFNNQLRKLLQSYRKENKIQNE